MECSGSGCRRYQVPWYTYFFFFFLFPGSFFPLQRSQSEWVQPIPESPRGSGTTGCLAIYAKWYVAPEGASQLPLFSSNTCAKQLYTGPSKPTLQRNEYSLILLLKLFYKYSILYFRKIIFFLNKYQIMRLS